MANTLSRRNMLRLTATGLASMAIKGQAEAATPWTTADSTEMVTLSVSEPKVAGGKVMIEMTAADYLAANKCFAAISKKYNTAVLVTGNGAFPMTDENNPNIFFDCFKLQDEGTVIGKGNVTALSDLLRLAGYYLVMNSEDETPTGSGQYVLNTKDGTNGLVIYGNVDDSGIPAKNTNGHDTLSLQGQIVNGRPVVRFGRAAQPGVLPPPTNG